MDVLLVFGNISKLAYKTEKPLLCFTVIVSRKFDVKPYGVSTYDDGHSKWCAKSIENNIFLCQKSLT
jgi:hypothetical protein